MDVFKLQASLGLNTEEYERALKAAVTQGESLTRNLGQMSTSSSGADAAITETATAVTDEGDAAKEAANQTTKLTESIEESGEKAKETNKDLKETADNLKKDLATAAKVGGAAFAATSAVIIKSTKDAVDNYAQYEQLVGGVETLFKDSADKVEKYAENAYKSAGLSANEYMETVTSFSASLLQGLEGDTSKAADVADLAIRDMSDNANKMGSAMESIQNAYSGFAKQNFTMLDNLKLGYGGTKEEMERLLADAEELSGIHYDIGNYADLIEAIHVVQTNIGITGTTAKEAATTIEGSANAAKAAWQNLLTGFGRDDADIDKLVDEVSDSVETLAKNVLPVAERAFVSLTKTATREAVSLAKQLPGLASSAAEEIHQTIAAEFGASADSIFAVEGAVKSAAAAFVAYKGAMVITDVVSGVQALIGVINGATTAQEALNAAGMANPYVLLATAIATATTALKSYIDTQTDLIDVASDTYNNLTDAQQAFIDSTNSLASGINSDINAAKSNIDSVNTEVGALQNMTDELYKINDAESLTNEQKAKMKTLVDSLNNSLPALNLELDKETGHLKNQRGEVDSLIESYSKQAKAQAAQESMVQLYIDQFEAEKNLQKAEKERANAKQKYDDLLWKSYQIESEMRKASAEGTNEGIDRYAALEAELKDVNEQIHEQENSLGEINASFVTANETLTNVNDSFSAMEIIVGEAAGATDLLADSTEESTSIMKEGMIAHQKVTRALASELKDYVVYVGGETYNISQDTYDKLQELNEEYSHALQEQEQNIRGSLNLFSEFNGGAETSSSELINNLWNNATELENWADNLASLADRGINEGLLNELEAAGPSSASKVKAMTQMSDKELKNYSEKWSETQKRIHEIAEDQAKDIKLNAEISMANLIGVADDNKDKVKEAYADLGRYMTDGAGGAIADGTSDYVVPVTGDMFNRMASEASNKLNEWDIEGDGENIPAGIAKGIENGEHWAIEAMWNLIGNVQNEYMKDTQSHSPSKLFRNLAEYIPQGVALGIEDGKRNVENAAKSMVQAAISATDSEINSRNKSNLQEYILKKWSYDDKNRDSLLKKWSYDNKNRDSLLGKPGDKTSLLVRRSDNDDNGSLLEREGSKNRNKTGSRARYTNSLSGNLTIKFVLANGKELASYVAPWLDILNARTITLKSRGNPL